MGLKKKFDIQNKLMVDSILFPSTLTLNCTVNARMAIYCNRTIAHNIFRLNACFVQPLIIKSSVFCLRGLN